VKALKTIKKRLLIALLLLLVLLASLVMLTLNSHGFQSFLAKRAVAWVNASYNTEIQLERVEIHFFDKLVLHDLYILDHRQDTLLRVHKLDVDIRAFRSADSYFDLDHAKIDGLLFNIRQYKGDTINSFTTFIDKFASDDTSSAEFFFRSGDVALNEVYFRFFDENDTSSSDQVDFEHIRLDSGKVFLKEFKLFPGNAAAFIQELAFVDSKGFDLQQLKGTFTMRPGAMLLQRGQIQTSNSKLKLEYSMYYRDFDAFGEFLDSVQLKARIPEGRLASEDLYYFSDFFRGLNETADIQLIGEGPINDLKLERAVLDLGKRADLKVKGSLKNITQADEAELNLTIQDLNFHPGAWDSLPNYPFSKSRIAVPEALTMFGQVEMEGRASGRLNSMSLKGLLEVDPAQDGGQPNFIDFDSRIAGLVSGDLEMDGRMNGILHLGNFLQNDQLGEASTESEFSVKQEAGRYKASGAFSRFDFRNYAYRNIQYQTSYGNDSLVAFAFVEDPNGTLELSLFGDMNARGRLESLGPEVRPRAKQVAETKLSGKIRLVNARPAMLKLFEGDTNILTETTANYSLNIDRKNNLEGGLYIDFIHLKNEEYDYTENDASIELSLQANRSELQVRSQSFDLSMKSNRDINVSNEVLSHVFDRFIPSKEPSYKARKGAELRAKLRVHKANRLLHVFEPKLSIEQQLDVDAEYRADDSLLRVTLNSPKITYGQFALKEPIVELKGDTQRLSLNFSSEELVLSDSFYLPDLILLSNLETDTFNLSLAVNREQKERTDNVYLMLDGHIVDGEVHGRMEDGHIQIRDSIWNFFDDGGYTLDALGMHIVGLGARSADKQIILYGDIGTKRKDQLNLDIENLNLDNVLSVLSNEKLQGSGRLSGTIEAASVLEELELSGQLDFSDLVLNEQAIGQGQLKGSWMGDRKGLDLQGSFLDEGLPVLWFKGWYYPYMEEQNTVINGLVRDFKLASLGPFLGEYLSDVQGTVSGELSMRGTPAKPRLYSNLKFNKAAATVNYLGTRYFIDGQTFKIREDWFGFDYIRIKDEDDRVAYANATIFHENYQKFNFDINLETKGFRVLNTDNEDNDLYYGNASVSGLFGVSGFADQLVIDADVKALENSNFYVPLEGAEEVTASDFIFFKTDDTSYVEPKVDLSGIQMNMTVEVDEGTMVQLIFDETAGDIMEARGDGSIRMEINTNGDFNMFGTYNVHQGSYLFTLQNIINKKFSIQDGSTIQWNGDPLHANLDLTAIYKVRARMSELLDDPSLTRRTNTEVLLHMSEDLLEPKIDFDLGFPDVDASLQTRAAAALSTAEARNNQVFSLLLLNSFVPSGASQLSGAPGSATADLLENQLSNWLSTLSDKVQLGVSELDAESFELALSKGFFNDRVTFETNLGVSGDESSDAETSGRFIGDFKLEYKIRPDGKLKAKVFNRSTDDQLINAQNSRDTQGVGLFFRQDFDGWGEFFRKTFKRNPENRSQSPDPPE
jgi:hypothetical protein